MSDINMPKLSDTMEEGTIVEWKKKSGDQVKTGDVLAEVESDKATFDLEADADGTLQILVEQGVPAKIGAPIARIGDVGARDRRGPGLGRPVRAHGAVPGADLAGIHRGHEGWPRLSPLSDVCSAMLLP